MKDNSITALVHSVALLAILSVLICGCAHWPATPRLERAGGPQRSSYLAQVTFDNLKDPEARAYFKQVKTSLVLPKEQVDRLRDVAGRLLHEAPAFQRLLEDLKSGH